MTFDNATHTVGGEIVSYNVTFGGQRNGVPDSATFCINPGQYFDAVLTPEGSID